MTKFLTTQFCSRKNKDVMYNNAIYKLRKSQALFKVGSDDTYMLVEILLEA